ncbi:MAG TPA: VOC family protein [Ktedonobacteraceae bacterium]|jgi:predicted enzyme related to lactoylglutathione lyase|nr:VOC family protein [Ktedonobacteraceae bacterium]
MKLVTQLTLISVLVQDQDEALHFYSEKLGLEKRTDTIFGPGLRLLTVALPGQQRPEIALAKPDAARHGEQGIGEVKERAGRRPPWIFSTEDCHKTYEILRARGVKFVSEPTQRLYGIEAVFEDPYGNAFALVEASPESYSLLLARSAA